MLSSRLTLRTLRLYQHADLASGILIFFMVVFSPWAFGTTQPWSIWTMNLCGYLLGLLLATKLYIRFRLGYRPSRWDGPSDLGRASQSAARRSPSDPSSFETPSPLWGEGGPRPEEVSAPPPDVRPSSFVLRPCQP